MKRKHSTIRTVIGNYCKAFAIPVALYLVLLLLIKDRIGNWNSIVTILVLTVVPTIAAYGLSFSAASGIMDFSIGSVMILAGMCAALAGHFFGVLGMFITAIVVAVLLDTIVGGMFAVLRIPSLVVSLGALMVFEVLGYTLAKFVATSYPTLSTGQYIKAAPALTFLGAPPWNFVVLILIAILHYFLYYRTKFSTQARMVGSDELIARNIGIKPLKVKFSTFLVGGFFLGVAAMISSCYSSAVGYKTEMNSTSMVFKPMMAVIVGGSLERFVKMPVGIFIGSLCVSIIFTGIIALGWPDSLQNVVLGLFMLIILAFPTIRQKMADYNRRRNARQTFDETTLRDSL